ncbi:MAG: PIG-L family deacetylase [Candidatus Viridilinea halotolerans]|uniref:PIG-L family deacetylase n=1 Tax=Candidatus Viridilinea halotolerans TaxID=2491704 RepID=A0A426U9V2_9CHLR|nr:MAG: PIG-L family deacetylase [Candidatus Viridilinea halotolerans]
MRISHIFLSPHLDDAALSCGGLIAHLTAQGHAVLVVTLCSGSPPVNASFSPFVANMHARWALPHAEVVRLRRAEDTEALALLAAEREDLDYLDAIYRMPEAYTSNERLFGRIAPTDPLEAQLQAPLTELATRYPSATFYAPLAIGNHVDHQIAYQTAHTLASQGIIVAYYEDFPYVAAPGALEDRLAVLGNQTAFMPIAHAIDATLAQKLAAIAAYRSQIGMLFGDLAAMNASVMRYAARVAPPGSNHGERLWVDRTLKLGTTDR